MTHTLDYRYLVPSEIEQAAIVLSRAFVDDPLYKFMLPIERTRLSTLCKFFRVYAKVNIKNQRGFCVGDPIEGVAFWKSPSQPSLTIRLRTPSVLTPLLFTLFPIGYLRSRSIRRKFYEMECLYAAEPHYYLNYIGVLPSARGKGLASRLIQPFLDKADAEGRIVYLETCASSNVPIYEHYGFQCIEQAAIPKTGVNIWAMRRPIHNPG